MTFQDMITELENLSVEQQLQLMESLSQQLQRSVCQANNHPMLGLFGVNRDVPKAEIKDMITDYLVEKYK